MKLFQRAQNSLFGEILDSLLAPALLVVLMSVGVTWLVARGISNAPFDRTLAHNVRALAHEATQAHTRGATLQITPTLLALLRGDDSDHIWLQVLDEDGQRLAGDAQMPAPQWSDTPQPDVVYLNDAQINGMEVRIAQLRVRVNAQAPVAPPDPDTRLMRVGPDGLPLDSLMLPQVLPFAQPAERTLLVQLAETRIKQAGHASEVITGVLLPQFALLPLAVMLLWIALARGIKPLSIVEERLRERRPDDLSPIDESSVPLEVAPLVSALNVLLAKLSDSMATQKRFLADAAHQLKTPLAGLRMQADLALREAADTHALKQSLKQIGRASVRATHTVNQLLALARAEGGIGTLARHPCDLARLTMEVVREMLPRAMDRSLDLGYDGAEPGAAGVVLEGNAALLRELIHNLLDNAINYTPSSATQPGVITARVLGDPFGHVLLLQVENSGAGIPEGERELIFEPFYRVLGNEADGSGLGLPIVREIANQHRAQVLLEEAHPGHSPPGTRFTVRFDTAP